MTDQLAPVDLRTARLDRGMSLAQMAREIGVTERVLGAAENGAVPRPSNALKIATYFGFRVTDQWPPQVPA